MVGIKKIYNLFHPSKIRKFIIGMLYHWESFDILKQNPTSFSTVEALNTFRTCINQSIFSIICLSITFLPNKKNRVFLITISVIVLILEKLTANRLTLT
jgi:hypothetical protein